MASSTQESEKDGLSKQVDEIKAELVKILNNSTSSPEELMQLYSQMFSKYQKMTHDKREPKTTIVQNTEKHQKPQEEVLNENDFTNMIMKTMPLSKRKNAQLLLNHVKASTQIGITDKGEVKINGEVIPKSHIIDLIHDFMRDRPAHSTAIGAVKFAKALSESNVPRYYIGNPLRLKLVDDLNDDEYKSALTTPVTPFLNNLDNKQANKTNPGSEEEHENTIGNKRKRRFVKKVKYSPWK